MRPQYHSTDLRSIFTSPAVFVHDSAHFAHNELREFKINRIKSFNLPVSSSVLVQARARDALGAEMSQ